MANFNLSDIALRSVCPNNKLLMDDKEMPSVMVWIPKFALKDVLNTVDTSVHPAFRRNGKEIPGFYVGKFLTHNHNGRAYSLPGEDPSASINLDTADSYCRAKGAGWHEITAAEWSAIALWCKKNGTMPKGNNNYGKDTEEKIYSAVPTTVDDQGRTCRTATGTGPVSWSHDGTLAGIFDLNGNVWKWCTGLRLVHGELQILKDNDAADASADLRADSGAWKAINGTTGELITPNGSGTTPDSVKLSWGSSIFTYTTGAITSSEGGKGCLFAKVTADATIKDPAKLLLRALTMLPDDGADEADYNGDYFYANVDEAERCLIRGGGWSNGGYAGVFHSHLLSPRSHVAAHLGGLSAFAAPDTAG